MSTKNLSIHILRSLPPNCTNRDKQGMPKTTNFGGVTRARNSSQSIKRALRNILQSNELPMSTRTRDAYQLLAQPLVDKGHSAEDAWEVVSGFLPMFFAAIDLTDERQFAKSVMVMDIGEIKDIIQYLHENFDIARDSITRDEKGEQVIAKDSVLKRITKQLTGKYQGITNAVDIALFGRMVSNNANLTTPAAMQVSHAITTNATLLQEDFWVVLDDLQREAANLDVAHYVSGVYYQVFNVCWPTLLDNLNNKEEIARTAVSAVLYGIPLAIPGGKRSGYFADSVPGLMLVEAREKGHPWSLANAFEKPISPRDGGLMHLSARALAEYWSYVASFGGDPSYIGLLPGAPEVTAGLDETSLHPDTYKGSGVLEWHTTLDGLVSAVMGRL